MSADQSERTEVRHEVGSDGTHAVIVSGEVDIFNSELFESTLSEALSGGPVVIDLRDCRYVDSAAIAALIRFRKKNSGDVKIVVNGKGAVRRVLSVTRIDEIIPIESVTGQSGNSTT